MNRFLMSIATAALMASPAIAAPYIDTETNDSFATANNIDNSFTYDANPEVAFGALRPTVTINGVSEEGGRDFFSFTVAANSVGYFDIDHAYNGGGQIDSYLTLYNSSFAAISQNDDSGGDPGSATGLDSYIQYAFTQAGLYFIRVSSCCERPFANFSGAGPSMTYQLHVSLENHPITGEVPEPAALGLFMLGIGGVAAARRRKTNR